METLPCISCREFREPAYGWLWGETLCEDCLDQIRSDPGTTRTDWAETVNDLKRKFRRSALGVRLIDNGFNWGYLGSADRDQGGRRKTALKIQ